MQCTTGWGKRHWQWGVVVHTLAVLGLMVLAGVGIYLESSGGWVVCPPQLVGTGERGEQQRRCRYGRFAWRAGWGWMRRSWMVVAARNDGGPGAVAYGAAKAGLLGLTRGLAKELAPRGITVNAVAPGLILETPFHDTFNTEEGRRAAIATIPLRRGGVPDDVAGTVLFLVSDLAGFITGEVTEINGGAWFK
jgi:NAD(P)-dependent dehydrogenase (short-subunit alcohol dehydrogenase family)